MIIIHCMKTLPRLVGAALSERMRVMPAVVVTGARQTGKSTLVEHLVPGKRRYATLDDLDVLDAARRDPEVLVGVPGPVTLDEVQREPELLRAVKRAIDRDRTPGRFLLTGSANLLLMRQVYCAAINLAGTHQSRWQRITRHLDHAADDCRWQALR
jgi:predicted AAA+ superfamily ATPase